MYAGQLTGPFPIVLKKALFQGPIFLFCSIPFSALGTEPRTLQMLIFYNSTVLNVGLTLT